MIGELHLYWGTIIDLKKGMALYFPKCCEGGYWAAPHGDPGNLAC